MFGRSRAHTSSTDEKLMELVARGSEPAFDELYGRYGRRLLFYFQKMLGSDAAKAEDFLHDLFLKIVERPELYAPGRSFSTWIFSIAHNMCKNEYRRLHVRQFADAELDEIPAGAESAIDAIDRQTFSHALMSELDQLDPDQRTTFLLRYHEHLSIREISQILGCPEGTVKSRLFNTARRLAERLRHYNPDTTSIDYERIS